MVGWHHWLMDMSLSRLWEMVEDRESLCPAVHGVTKSRAWLSDWTTSLKQLLNRILKPSISRVKLSGNLFQQRLAGSTINWLWLKPETIGSASLRLTTELWGTRAAVTQGNSLMCVVNLTACRSWGEFYKLDHTTSLFKGERCSNIWQSLMTDAQKGYATLQQRRLWKRPRAQEEARDSWKGSGVITSVDVKCSLLFFLVCVFSKFSTMNMYPLTLFAVRIT